MDRPVKARCRIVRRMVRLMEYGRTHRYGNLLEMAREFGVSDRTLRRDLEVLEAEGVRVPKWREREMCE